MSREQQRWWSRLSFCDSSILVCFLMLLLGRDGLDEMAVSVPDIEVPSAIGEYTVRYAEVDCPFIYDYDVEPEVLEAITCGYMQVPQDRRAPDGLQIEIAVAIVASRSDEPYADPILYMEGGPGGGALISAGSWLESPLRDERDIIVFDQRGTGFSWPNLGCPELDEVDEWDFDASLIALADCRARLERMGVDLAAYHSATNALDVADLRQVLGLESWNLLGISYGTRLALTVLRDQPYGVRSVILDSVYPPNVDAYVEQALTFGNAINALLDGCAEDRECSAAFPDLRQNFYELLLELDEEPLYFYAEDIDTDEDIEVDAYTFVSLLTNALYDTDLIPLLPMLIDDTYYGYYDLLIEEFLLEEDEGWWSRQRPDDAEPVDEGSLEDAQGMFYSVECYEEAAFVDLDEVYRRAEGLDPLLTELLVADVAQFLDACAVWLPDATLVRKAAAVHSDLPVLILAGEYDPVTPPAWARLAAQTLPNHVVVELPRGGHGLTDLDECISSITLAFLAAPTRRISTRCLADSVRPFAVP